MATSAFYDAGPLRQVAINLFYGWGYNFYRKENQLRADDQLVRAKAGALLGSARKSIDSAESVYRREFLPQPTREKPFPDAKAVANAQALERLAHAVDRLITLINNQPVPENDRMTQRYRQEAETLQRLIESDQQLVGQVELLRTMVDQKTGQQVLEMMASLEEGIGAISETLRQRQMLLFPG